MVETDEPASLAGLSGLALAQWHLREAFAALHAAGDSRVEAFRRMRLELNRLEQGGMAEGAAPSPIAPTQRSRRSSVIPIEMMQRARTISGRLGKMLF
jgi:hypothetical protein